MNPLALKLIALLKQRYPSQVLFRRKLINQAALELGLEGRDYVDILANEFKVRKGLYDFTKLVKTPAADQQVVVPTPAEVANESSPTAFKMTVASVVNTDSYIPVEDPTYVRWGEYDDVAEIIASRSFYPIYIAGLSGNGKTMMVEQACAAAKREYIRVQISPETDEDDLIGGFRLLNGETVFAKGPVVKAMERGAILLIDEIDRATNKIMCLQGVLEGKPIMIKKTGEVIRPALGFNVIATANTKGKGSDDGRFVSATIIDEAFLERFVATIEQPYPTRGIELKIVQKHMEKFDARDEDFADKLVTWSEVIRKTFEDDGVDELISTRRLCHIVHTFSIFKNRVKAIDMCISRFDADTKTAFKDLYTKIDPSINPVKPKPGVPAAPIGSKDIPF